MSAETEDLLERLSRHAPVAVITGRSISDLKKHMGIRIPYCIGNHGLEGGRNRGKLVERAREVSTGWMTQLGAREETIARLSGVEIEDKNFSISLHFRRSRNKKETHAKLLEIASELRPAPRMIPGKCVINLVPAGSPHKGIALQELMNDLDRTSALYIGDDDTDEDVFSLPDSRIISIRVGKHSSSRAWFFLKKQTEMNRLLRKLVQFHEERSRK